MGLDTITAAKFSVYFIQDTYDDCSYSIACGHLLYPLQAQTREEALDEIRQMAVGTPQHHPRFNGIDEAFLFEALHPQQVPIDVWRKEKFEAERKARMKERKVYQKQEAAAKEAKERKEYERLKLKYEPPIPEAQKVS